MPGHGIGRNLDSPDSGVIYLRGPDRIARGKCTGQLFDSDPVKLDDPGRGWVIDQYNYTPSAGIVAEI